MARLFGATYQPYTYEELAAPVREATTAHQKVEEDYNNNMLVVDSLRQRAMNEPDAKWSQQILDYANQLEGYAMDLARNGLTRETRGNLLNMKRGYGTTVSPVLMAMQREKELQTIRDKANPATRTLYGNMPTIDELIANPNASQTSYSGKDIYDTSKAQSAAYAARNIDIIPPRNISAWMYEYGKKQGFTQDEINDALQDPFLNGVFNSIKQQYGYIDDSTLTAQQKNKLDNEILLGALEGLVGTVDMKYGNRPDNPGAIADLYGKQLNNKLTKMKIDALGNPQTQGNGMYHTEYFTMDDKYQNLSNQRQVLSKLYNEDGKLNDKFSDFKVYNENGKPIYMDFMKAYKAYIEPLEEWYNSRDKVRYDSHGREISMGKPLPQGVKNEQEALERLNYYNSIGANKDTYNALKDFGVDNLSGSEIAGTLDDLDYYMNNLASNKHSTDIDFTDFNIVSSALNEYASKHDKYYKDITEYDENLNNGKESGKKIRLNEIKGDDILGVDYLISDPYKIYVTCRTDNGPKILSIPMSFFNSELSDYVRTKMSTGKKSIDDQGNESWDIMPYEYGVDFIDRQNISRQEKNALKSNLKLQTQDQIAFYIQEYFKHRQEQIFGKTQKRDD